VFNLLYKLVGNLPDEHPDYFAPVYDSHSEFSPSAWVKLYPRFFIEAWYELATVVYAHAAGASLVAGPIRVQLQVAGGQEPVYGECVEFIIGRK
jgi:hypothetical protein